MNEPISFSEQELALLVELLEHEDRELPTEIRHTRLADYRDTLHQRQDLVRSLLERLRVTVPQ